MALPWKYTRVSNLGSDNAFSYTDVSGTPWISRKPCCKWYEDGKMCHAPFIKTRIHWHEHVRHCCSPPHLSLPFFSLSYQVWCCLKSWFESFWSCCLCMHAYSCKRDAAFLCCQSIQSLRAKPYDSGIWRLEGVWILLRKIILIHG